MSTKNNFWQHNSRLIRSIAVVLILSVGMLALVLSAAAQEPMPAAPAAPANAWGNPLPEEINYQGQLVDSNGIPQVGSYTMEFSIFTGPPDHNLLYTETQTVSTDEDGLFNLMIGAVQPGLDAALLGGEAWLEVKLDGEILAPRQPVGSVAYALYAQHLIGGTGEYSVISGGYNNDAPDFYSTVGGGTYNEASGPSATVGGGEGNTASNYGATVGGGGSNEASSSWATVGGGDTNSATGLNATIPGGGTNIAAGWFSFAAGRAAQANHHYAFVWSGSPGDFFSTGEQQFLIDASGGVGINTNAPQTQFHVLDTIAGNANNLDAHVVAFQNDATSTPDVLALQVDGVTNPQSNVNFITFFDASGAIAAIEGNGSGGVAYNTSGADFAEYLPLSPAITGELSPGTVLGLTGDTLHFSTAAAQRVMVVSSAPGFVGNADEAEGNANMALVAFMGQVPVLVRGPVQAGDLLVASGRSDGTAVAVSPENLSPALANQIIGQALESSHTSGISLVNTLVGQPSDAFWAARLSEMETRLADLEAALQKLTNGE